MWWGCHSEILACSAFSKHLVNRKLQSYAIVSVFAEKVFLGWQPEHMCLAPDNAPIHKQRFVCCFKPKIKWSNPTTVSKFLSLWVKKLHTFILRARLLSASQQRLQASYSPKKGTPALFIIKLLKSQHSTKQQHCFLSILFSTLQTFSNGFHKGINTNANYTVRHTTQGLASANKSVNGKVQLSDIIRS